jgi:hypothetical protein
MRTNIYYNIKTQKMGQISLVTIQRRKYRQISIVTIQRIEYEQMSITTIGPRKYGQISMFRTEFESVITVFENAKIIRVLARISKFSHT